MSGGLEPVQKEPWHQSVGFLVTALLVAGPFAIPLVWNHKKLPIAAKLGLTIVTVGLTLWLFKVTAQATVQLQTRMKELNSMLTAGSVAQ